MRCGTKEGQIVMTLLRVQLERTRTHITDDRDWMTNVSRSRRDAFEKELYSSINEELWQTFRKESW